MFFDELLHHLGEFGPYQRRVYFLSCMLVIPTAWHIAIQVFTAGYTDHWCTVPELEATNCVKWNLTYTECDNAKRDAAIPAAPGEEFPYDQCKRYNLTGIEFYPGINTSVLTDDVYTCDAGWDYDTSQYTSTIITDFDLVCSKSSFSDLAQSVFFVGVVLGSFLFGSLADRIGRHPALFMAVAIQCFVGIAISFSPNYIVYIILRTVLGMGNHMVLVLAFVMGTEFVGPSKRVYAGVVMSFFLATGNISLALIASLVRKWRILQFVISVPALLSLCLYFAIPESARWLVSQGKHNKAKKVIRTAARYNKVTIPDYLLSPEKMQEDVEPDSSVLDIWRYPQTRIRMIILIWVAFVNSFLYYGLTLSAGDLGDLDYVAFFVSGVVEIPAYFFCLFFLDKWGRRFMLAMFFFISGIACLVTILLPIGIANTVVAMIGKLGASGALCISPFYTVELLPTPVRSSGMGLATMALGTGSILAPILFVLADYWEPLPMVVFGVGGVSAGLSTVFLPETMGTNLPETMEDGERFGKKQIDDEEMKATETDANANTDASKNSVHANQIDIETTQNESQNEAFETDAI